MHHESTQHITLMVLKGKSERERERERIKWFFIFFSNIFFSAEQRKRKIWNNSVKILLYPPTQNYSRKLTRKSKLAGRKKNIVIGNVMKPESFRKFIRSMTEKKNRWTKETTIGKKHNDNNNMVKPKWGNRKLYRNFFYFIFWFHILILMISSSYGFFGCLMIMMIIMMAKYIHST